MLIQQLCWGLLALPSERYEFLACLAMRGFILLVFVDAREDEEQKAGKETSLLSRETLIKLVIFLSSME